jgi:hypothetical protein
MAITGLDKQVARMDAVSDEIQGKVFLKHLRWVGASTSGHTLIVTDNDGSVLWESIADGSNYIDIHPFYKIVKGVKIQAMPSGRLYAYLG